MFGHNPAKLRLNLQDSESALDPRPARQRQALIERMAQNAVQNLEAAHKRVNAKLSANRSFPSFPPGSIIYSRDFRIVPTMKQRTKFLSAPLLVLKEYSTTVLARSHFGFAKLLHKDNIRLCPEKEPALFASLPPLVQSALGFPFLNSDLAAQISSGKLSPFFTAYLSPPPPERPVTRSMSKLSSPPTLSTEPDPNLALEAQFFPFLSDDQWAHIARPVPPSSSSLAVSPPKKNVTFAV